MEWHLIHFSYLAEMWSWLCCTTPAARRSATRHAAHTQKSRPHSRKKKNSLSAFTSWVSSYSHIKARRFRPFWLYCIWKECGIHYLFLFNDCVARVAEQYLPMATSKYNFISTHPQTINQDDHIYHRHHVEANTYHHTVVVMARRKKSWPKNPIFAMLSVRAPIISSWVTLHRSTQEIP